MAITVQTGTLTIAASTASNSATLGTTVDATKSILFLSQNGGDAGAPRSDLGGGYLNSGGTTVTVERVNSPGVSISFRWTVVTFDSGVTVYRGSTQYTSSTTSQTISIGATIDTTKSFLIANTTPDGANFDGNAWPRIRISSSTQLTLDHQSGITTSLPKVHWQVVQFDAGLSVQRGTKTWTGTAAAATTTQAITSVDTSKSFISNSSYYITTTANQNLSVYSLGARITSGTQITFERKGGAVGIDYEIAWEVVTFDAGTDTSVQEGQFAFPQVAGDLTRNATISSVDTTRSVVLGGYLQGYGDRASDIGGAIRATLALTSATNVQAVRTSTADEGWINYQAIQFAEPLSPVNVSVPKGSLTLTGKVPTVQVTTQIAVPKGSLSLGGKVPTVTATGNFWADVPKGTLTVTGKVPTVTATDNRWADVPKGSLSLTGYAPTVTAPNHVWVDVPKGALTITGYAPTVVAQADVTIEVPKGALSLYSEPPTIAISFGGAPPDVSGRVAAGVEDGLTISLPYTVAAGFSRTVLIAVGLEAAGEPEVASLTFGGKSPDLVAANRLEAGQTDHFAFVYALREGNLPPGQSGSIDLVVTGVPATDVNASLSALTLGNVAQADPEAVVFSEAFAATVSSGIRTRTPGAIVVDYVTSQSPDVPLVADAGQDVHIFVSEKGTSWGLSSKAAPQEALVTMGWSQALPEGQVAELNHLVLAFAPATGAVTTVDMVEEPNDLGDGHTNQLDAAGDVTEAVALLDAMASNAQGFHSTDFSGTATDATPTGWYLPTGYTAAWQVKVGPTAIGGKFLRNTTLTRGRKHFIWDDVTAARDVNILAKVRANGSVAGVAQVGVVWAWVETSSAVFSGHYLALSTDSAGTKRLALAAYVNNAQSNIADVAFEWTAATAAYWMRVAVEGATVRCRCWLDGETEPTLSWNIERTRLSDFPVGEVGIYSFGEYWADVDYISVGTNGLQGTRPTVTADASITEAVTLSDAMTGGIAATSGLTEPLSLADTMSPIRVSDVSITEAITLADAIEGGRLVEDGLTEAVTLTDALTYLVAGDPINAVTGVAPADAMSSRLVATASITEAVTLTDDYAPGGTLTGSITESLDLSDTYNREPVATLAFGSGALDLGDGPEANIVAEAAWSDVGVTEGTGEGNQPDEGVSLDDGLHLDDVMDAYVNVTVTEEIVETLDLADSMEGVPPWETTAAGNADADWTEAADGGSAIWEDGDEPEDPWEPL